MARRRTSTFDDLVIILSRLPWWVSLGIGFFAWLILNPIANNPVVVPADVKPGDMSSVMLSRLWHTSAMIGRYLIPLVCLFGVIGSIAGRQRRSRVAARGLLVLLVPCTDWFITFSQLGNGNVPRAIAVTPINLLLQLLLLPFYLWLMLGAELSTALARLRHLASTGGSPSPTRRCCAVGTLD